MLFVHPALAGFVTIKSIINTQSTRDVEAVKRLKKVGMLHTGNQLNSRMKNLKVLLDRSTGELKIEFDYPILEWALASYAYPLWINLSDKNGNILDRFKTVEDFVPEGVYKRTDPKTNGKALLDRKDGKPNKAFLMKLTGNMISYDVKLRDAPYIEIVEVGFVTMLADRQNSMEEFVPEKIFIKDWSKDKEYK